MLNPNRILLIFSIIFTVSFCLFMWTVREKNVGHAGRMSEIKKLNDLASQKRVELDKLLVLVAPYQSKQLNTHIAGLRDLVPEYTMYNFESHRQEAQGIRHFTRGFCQRLSEISWDLYEVCSNIQYIDSQISQQEVVVVKSLTY